jgi:hypothetical protein
MNLDTVARIVAAFTDNDGVLTVDSATKAGIPKSTLLHAVEQGIVVRSARDRYVLPGNPSRELAYKGAYLGHDAVLSIDGAWTYWGLDGIEGLRLAWSVPHGSRITAPNVYRRRKYHELEVVERGGIGVTSVRQTLLDAAARFDLDLVERGYECALRRGLLDDIETREWVRDRGGWHGAPGFRAVLARRKPGERPIGSDVGVICLQLYRRARIPAVREWEVLDLNGELIGYADFGHPPRACLSEVDGVETHDREHRQHDYNRQGRIEDVGYLVRRHTAEDVRYRPRYVEQRTRTAMKLARPLKSLVLVSSKTSSGALWRP